MTSPRRSLSWSVAVLLAFAAIPALAEPSASALEVVEQAVCASAESSEVSESSESSEASPDEAAGLICMSTRCSSDTECRNACPTARTAVCSFNACRYTYSGGGGGGGPTCPSSRCIYDSDCVCGTAQGYCVQRACTY